MRWINVEYCTPWTEEEVLCKVENYSGLEECQYCVCRFMGGVFWKYSGSIWNAFPEEVKITKWTHIHD